LYSKETTPPVSLYKVFINIPVYSKY